MPSEVKLDLMNNLCLHNISINRNFHQNWLINECARKNLAKILKSQNYGITESLSFLLWDVQDLTFLIMSMLLFILKPLHVRNLFYKDMSYVYFMYYVSNKQISMDEFFINQFHDELRDRELKRESRGERKREKVR